MRLRRVDTVRLDKLTRTPEGFLVADAQTTRTGVFEYTFEDGTTQRELRLAEDVFDPESLASFDLKPLTLDHPPGGVDPENARAVAVGVVTDPKRAADGQHMSARIAVYDAKAIAAIENGKRELSNGYTAILEPIKDGEHTMPDGSKVKADFIQRQIRGNHTAIVDRGRAGPTCRLDSAGHAIPDPNQESSTMDPKQIEKMIADAVEKASAESKARIDAIEKSSAEKAKTDAAELEKLRGENAALKARSDAEQAERAKTAHAALVARVAPVLGQKPAELLAKTDAELRRAVVLKLVPALSVEGKTDEMIAGAFEVAIAGERNDTAGDTARLALISDTGNGPSDSRSILDAARAKMKQQTRDAWKMAK